MLKIRNGKVVDGAWEGRACANIGRDFRRTCEQL